MEITAQDFTRLANNFYNQTGVATDIQRISLDSHLFNYINDNAGKLPKYKVAFCSICINPLYWTFAKPMIDGAKQFFLPGHDVDYFLWSDVPEKGEKIYDQYFNTVVNFLRNNGKLSVLSSSVNAQGQNVEQIQLPNEITDSANKLKDDFEKLRKKITIIPMEGAEWPLPTLMRHSFMLQQEEKLAEYDYIFYCDVDMRFVNFIGDEILGKGLTAAPHPGYYLRKECWPPYEPNKHSTSYINRPGLVINDAGKPRFMPMYFAGGLQGGVTSKFIQAMKDMKKIIEKDMGNNYIPIWNDETVWNKYLEKTPQDLIFLDPGYIYPDSLIKEYYEPIVWGRSFIPRLVTLTKPFSVSKEGGEAVAKMIQK